MYLKKRVLGKKKCSNVLKDVLSKLCFGPTARHDTSISGCHSAPIAPRVCGRTCCLTTLHAAGEGLAGVARGSRHRMPCNS